MPSYNSYLLSKSVEDIIDRGYLHKPKKKDKGCNLFYSNTHDPMDDLPLEDCFCVSSSGGVISFLELQEWKKKRGLL